MILGPDTDQYAGAGQEAMTIGGIAAVARSVMNVVKYSVERALGIPVAEVNVHVEGLRVSEVD